MKVNIINIFTMICLMMVSCGKSNENLEYGSAYLNVKISDGEYALVNNSNAKLGALSVDRGVEMIIPWNTEMDVVVRLNKALNTKTAAVSAKGKRIKAVDKDVHYRLLVFNSKNEYLSSKDYIVGKEAGNGIALSTAEKYSFIVYSFGEKSKLPNLNLKIGESIDNALLSLQGSTDVMMDTRSNIQLAVGDNNLGLTLKHLFSEVNVTLNTESVGMVEAVGNLNMSNVYASANVAMHKHSSYPNNLIFNGNASRQTLSSFQSDQFMTASISDIVFSKGDVSNVLTLEKLKIGGLQKENLELYSFAAQPGVSYDIEIILKAKEGSMEGFNDGTLIWALGNLIQVGENQYAFAESQGEYGDYWYRSNDGKVYSNPMDMDDKHNIENGGVPVDNICGKVGAGWRLPTEEEIRNLEKEVDWYGKSNKAYGAYIKPDGNSVTGIYIGTSTVPTTTDDQDKYLFLPAAGAYNSGNPAEIGQSSFYWHSGNTTLGQSTSFQISSHYFSANNDGGKDRSRTNSVRCVRDAK